MTGPLLPTRPLSRQLITLLSHWRNTVFSTFDHLWMLLLWAVSTPIFIHSMGKNVFGVWILINSLIGLGGVMSFGFGEATMRFVAHYRARGETDKLRRVVEASALLYAITSLVFSAAIWAGANWIVSNVFSLNGAAAGPAVAGLQLAAVALLVTAFLKTFEAAINGCERFDVTARVSMITRSFIILGNVALALSGFGLAAFLGVALAGLCGQTAALFLIARHRYIPGLRPLGWADRQISSEILRFGLQSWLQICAGAMSNIFDRFLVGALIDPAAAGVYTVCLQLAQQVHLLLYRGLAWMMPAASRDTAKRSGVNAMLASYRAGAALSLATVAAVAMPVYVLAPQALNVWLGADFSAQGTEVLELLLVYFALWCLAVPGSFLINGAGHPGWNSTATLLHGAVILGLASLLLPQYGLIGVAFARLTALPTMLITFYALHSRVLIGGGLSISWTFVGRMFAIFAVAGLLHSALSGLVPAHLPTVLFSGLALGITGAALVVATLWLSRRHAASKTGA
jgi:O-antigen/teichoic acid export membrane protein